MSARSRFRLFFKPSRLLTACWAFFLVGLRFEGDSKTHVTGPITFLGHALLKVTPLPPDEFSVINVGDPGGGAQQATVRRTLELSFVMHKEKPV